MLLRVSGMCSNAEKVQAPLVSILKDVQNLSIIFGRILYLKFEKNFIVTFLAVLAIKAQRAIAFITVLFGHAVSPISTWRIHTGMDSVLYVDSRSEILLHVNRPVIQYNLGLKEKRKQCRNLQIQMLPLQEHIFCFITQYLALGLP